MYDSNEASCQTLQAVDPVRRAPATNHRLPHPGACAGSPERHEYARELLRRVCQAAMADNDRPRPGARHRRSCRRTLQRHPINTWRNDYDELQLPLFWLPGNHDDPDVDARTLLGGERISAAKQVLIGNWLIVLLDSTIKGETGGNVSARADRFPAGFIASAPLSTTPWFACITTRMPAGSEWMDRLGLQQPQPLHRCAQVACIM